MIETTIVNVGAFKELAGKMLTAVQAERMLREIATNVRTLQRERIHEDGKKADGTLMGQYSKEYLKLRLAKGKPSDHVRLFWEGDLANQYSVVPLSKTEYGLGWSNSKQAEIAEYQEDRFGKIWALTTQELEEVRATISDYIAKIFK